jgi:tetratricopeptide (TPR) repeat protein
MRVRGSISRWVGVGLLWLGGCYVFSQHASRANSSIDQQAADAYAQNRFQDAARLYRQAVKSRPDWAEGWGYLAASLYNLNRYADARDAYRQTTELTPNNGPSWAYMGFCEYELRDYRNAFDHLSKAKQLGVGNDLTLLSRLHYELALLWDTAGQFDMAMKEIAFLANAGDKSPPVIEATGLIVLQIPIFPYEIPTAKHELVMKTGEAGWKVNAQQVEQARQLYKELVARHPREANLHYAYGLTLTVSDQDGAIAELEKALALNPRHVPALIEVSFLCLEAGSLEKSERMARRAMVIEPKNYAPHNILGRILVQTGHAELGIAELETAVKLAPTIASSHFNLAQAYQKAGKGADAAREFAAFKELDQAKEGQDGAPEQHR